MKQYPAYEPIFRSRPFVYYTLEPILLPSRAIHANVHVEYGPGMVRKGVLRGHVTSLPNLMVCYVCPSALPNPLNGSHHTVTLWLQQQFLFRPVFFPPPLVSPAQMIWSQTSRVGCAIQRCPKLKGLNTEENLPSSMFICTYSPAYIESNEVPYTVGQPCSKCPPSSARCVSGLCALNITEKGKYTVILNQFFVWGHLKISHFADKRKNFHMGGGGGWTRFVVRSTAKKKKKKKKKNAFALQCLQSQISNKKCMSLFPISKSVGARVQTWSINRRCRALEGQVQREHEGAGRLSLQFDTE